MIATLTYFSSKKTLSLTFLSIILGALIVPIFYSHSTDALSGGDFNPAHIIDDVVFTNSSAMSVQDIQNFMNAQLPTCDTNGNAQKSYYYNSSTGEINNPASGSYVQSNRTLYGQRYATWYNAHPYAGYVINDSVGPYVCLKNYIENPSNGQNNLQNPTDSVAGGIGSAQIIYNAAHAYSINPEVLLTTLQKEQGMLSDDWPWLDEYQHAMGYNCSDTSQCNGFAGFYQQVNAAAKQYRSYLNNPYNYNYVAGSGNKIYYNVISKCSNFSNVNIQNQATAALYDYTPYQPNSNVLASTNPTGSSSGPGGTVAGDNCAAYGNRNFWWYFNTWFGSSIVGCPQVDTSYVYRLYRSSDGDYLYTQNNSEICQAVLYYGYTLENPAFQPTASNDTNAIPLYRLSRKGIHFYTTDPIERAQAIQNYGYNDEGTPFYVSSASSSSNYPVYRLSKNGTFFYTPSVNEKYDAQGIGYNYQGASFYVNSPSTKTPVYRLSKNGMHLYTSSNIEKTIAINQNGYADEGIAFYAQSGITGDTSDLYRLVRSGPRLLTTSMYERQIAANSNYGEETSYMFVYPANYAGTIPVYRLSNAKNGDYLFTTNAAERDAAVQQYGYKYEGVQFDGSP